MTLLFFSSFLFYLCGLCGTVPAYRDSGDLIASIHTLGIAHPPGYVLYVILGKVFVTLLPVGNVAYRVNVMSAVFAGLAMAVFGRVLVRRWPSQRAISLAAIVLLATSPAVVSLARVAEMYTLSLFLAIGIFGLLSAGRPGRMPWAALLLGLGLSVHPTLLFLLPLFVPSLLEADHKKPIGKTVLFFCVGLSIFLYLPLRASQHPLVNWGDPEHWRNFWRVVTRADYGGLKLHPVESVYSWTPRSIVMQLKYFFVAFSKECGLGALVLGILGIYSAFRDGRRHANDLVLLISWLLAGPGFFLLSNLPLHEATTPAILQPYLLLPGFLWVPFIVNGASFVLSARPPRHWMTLGLAIALLVSRPWVWATERQNFYVYDYARNLLRSLPQNAVLYDPDDPTYFSIQVLQTVEHRRNDIVLLSFFRTRWGYEAIKRRWPDLLPPIPMNNGQELSKSLWSYSARKYPFYAELPQKFEGVPYLAEGLVYAAQVPPQAEDPARSRQRAESLLALYPQRGDYVTTHHSDFFTAHVVSYYAAAENNLGIEYAHVGQWDRAMPHYRKALEMEPDQKAAHNNLAIAGQKMQKLL